MTNCTNCDVILTYENKVNNRNLCKPCKNKYNRELYQRKKPSPHEEHVIISYIQSHYDNTQGEVSYYVNNDTWSLAELFVRQYLNNRCDGFGLSNVLNVYHYLRNHKEELVQYKMIGETGYNNFGYQLWSNYDV